MLLREENVWPGPALSGPVPRSGGSAPPEQPRPRGARGRQGDPQGGEQGPGPRRPEGLGPKGHHQAATTASQDERAGLRPFTYAAKEADPLGGQGHQASWGCHTPRVHLLGHASSGDHVLLLDNDMASDVEFVVGPEGDTWRIPGHRDVLSAASPVFKAMLTGPMAHGGRVRVDDIDGRAFYQLLRVLYGAQPEIRSEQTCLLTMYAANKYMCTRLFLHCVETADDFLRPAGVLRVMQAIRFFLPDDLDVDSAFTPTAPPLEDASDGELGPTTGDAVTPPSSKPLLAAVPSLEKQAPPTPPKASPPPPQQQPAETPREIERGPAPVSEKDFPDPTIEANMGWYCGALYWNCLQFVDTYVDDVLECECVEELHRDDLVALLRRDTLHVRREARLFHALVRWADRDCKRRGERCSAENKRRALGEALYLVRYLRMSMADLLGGPIKSGLLDPGETAWILGQAVGNPQAAAGPPESLRPFAHLLGAPRPAPRPRYIPLSARSAACGPAPTTDGTTMTDWPDMSKAEVKRQAKALRQAAKMKKKEEKRARRRTQEQQRGGGACGQCSAGCFAEAFFAVLACIFD